MLDELRAFVAVVDKTSLTKAADALSLTQSAISRRIQQLEETLDATLLDRTRRPPTATAVGQRVYHCATALLRDLDYLLGIPKEEEEPSGILRIGLPQVVADAALFDISMRMKTEFPTLDLKCRTQESTGLQVALATGELDAAIVLFPPGNTVPRFLSASHITTFDVVVVQSKQNPIVPQTASVADIADCEWILNPQGCGYRAALERATESAGRKIRFGIDVHGSETQLRLVAAGLGLGLVPRHLLSISGQRRALSEVKVKNLTIRIEVTLMHAAQLGNLRRAVSILHEVLSEKLSTDARG